MFPLISLHCFEHRLQSNLILPECMLRSLLRCFANNLPARFSHPSLSSIRCDLILELVKLRFVDLLDILINLISIRVLSEGALVAIQATIHTPLDHLLPYSFTSNTPRFFREHLPNSPSRQIR